MKIYKHIDTFCMTNINRKESNLSENIWVDSAGIHTNVPHSTPRFKLLKDNSYIPFSLTSEPENLVKNDKTTLPKDVKQFIVDNLDIFLKHWNGQITDTQLLMFVHAVQQENLSKSEAIEKLKI